jgi:RNA polymerase sigma factor (sigma-70 family)
MYQPGASTILLNMTVIMDVLVPGDHLEGVRFGRTGAGPSIGGAGAPSATRQVYPSGANMIDSADLVDLVAAAAAGDQAAWDQLVERFLPLVRHVVRSFRLAEHDVEDVSQLVWLRLVEHLGDIREPRALPGWISTTARNASLALLRARRTTTPIEDDIIGFEEDPTEALYREQRREALLQGLAELPERHRDLLLLLLADPPVPYGEISRRLGIPIGSIGPNRARALQKLRETRSMAALMQSGAEGHR